SVVDACSRFGISRKTGYKWLKRFDAAPEAPLDDRSTRPHHSPTRTNVDVEAAVLDLRQRFGWGSRKIHALLRTRLPNLPSVRTIANILQRNQCVRQIPARPAANLRFERAFPNDLWQCDFKGYVEVQGRRVFPFTILDDHSRYLFAAHPCLNQTMDSAW